jgi:tripartite-type tricarboxylate transporter receptor subunit TctC
MTTRRSSLAGIGLIIAATLLPGGAARADYPDRPIRILLGFAAGSGADILARWYAEKLREVCGATVIIENKPGASGNLAVDAGAKAKPDGYTLLMASTATTAGNSAIYKNVPFDVTKDIVPITTLNENGFALAINPQTTPVKTVAELTPLLKAKNGKATYGWATTVGLAASVIYAQTAGIEMVPVAYKITPTAVSDLAAGQIDLVFADVPFAVGQEKQGRIKILAVTTAQRAPGLPDIPTMDELGYRTSDTTPLWSMWAPTGTPQNIVDKLAKWLNQVVEMPATRDFLIPQGASPVSGSPEFLKKKLAEAIISWNKVAEVAKIDPQQ